MIPQRSLLEGSFGRGADRPPVFGAHFPCLVIRNPHQRDQLLEGAKKLAYALTIRTRQVSTTSRLDDAPEARDNCRLHRLHRWQTEAALPASSESRALFSHFFQHSLLAIKTSAVLSK